MRTFVAIVTMSFLLSWQSLMVAADAVAGDRAAADAVAGDRPNGYQQPTTPTALQWYNQAQQLEAAGRYAEAVSAYNAVIQTPDVTQQACIACTWAHRGLCLERLGDYNNAASSYTQALQYGEIPFAREGLGRIRARMQPQQQPNYRNVPRQQQYQPSLESSIKELCNQPPINYGDAMRFSLFCNSGNSSLPPEVIANSKKMGCEGNCLMDHTSCVISHMGSSYNSDDCDLQRKKCEQSCQ